MPRQYSQPVFHFTVQWGGTCIGFSEVSGLARENQMIECPDGESPECSTARTPRMRKSNTLTLRRGIAKSDNEFLQWLSMVPPNSVERRDVTISLLGERHEPVMAWKVRNAFPVKLEAPRLAAGGEEVAIESIELAHEGLALQNE